MSVVALKALDELRVWCRFGLRETHEGDWAVDSEGGCPAQILAGEADVHEATCGYELLRCCFAGCGVEVRKKDLDAHNEAQALQHARGEREARLALETSSSSRIAELQAALQNVQSRSSSPPTLFRTIQAGHPVKDTVWGLSFSPDSTTIACSTTSGVVKLFNVASGAQIREYVDTLSNQRARSRNASIPAPSAQMDACCSPEAAI